MRGQVDKRLDVPKDAWVEAQRLAAQSFQPSRVWTMDLCRIDDGRLQLLEIGCFNCAELYACDLSPIVREVSRIALEDWQGLRD